MSTKQNDEWWETVEENEREREQTRREESAGRAADAEARTELRAEKQYAAMWKTNALNAIGGDMVTANEFTFKVSDNSVMITKRSTEITGIERDKEVGMIYDPTDAHRIAEILRMHVPLIKSLEAAMTVVRTVDADKSPATAKFYIEANLLLEMLAKEKVKS